MLLRLLFPLVDSNIHPQHFGYQVWCMWPQCMEPRKQTGGRPLVEGMAGPITYAMQGFGPTAENVSLSFVVKWHTLAAVGWTGTASLMAGHHGDAPACASLITCTCMHTYMHIFRVPVSVINDVKILLPKEMPSRSG